MSIIVFCLANLWNEQDLWIAWFMIFDDIRMWSLYQKCFFLLLLIFQMTVIAEWSHRAAIIWPPLDSWKWKWATIKALMINIWPAPAEMTQIITGVVIESQKKCLSKWFIKRQIAKLCLPTFPRQIALYSPCRLLVVTFCYH